MNGENAIRVRPSFLQRRWFLSVFVALIWPSTVFPQAFIEQLSPPVLQRGATTRIEVLGSDTAGAVGLWSSLPAEVFRFRPVSSDESHSNSAAFDVELAREAPLGLYGLRLATRSGLSNVHLFLIDELSVTQHPTGEPEGVSPRTGGNPSSKVQGLTPPGSPK